MKNNRIPRTFERAFALHQSGKLDRAEALYAEILKVTTRHPKTLFQLGVIAYQKRDFALASERLRAAISQDPQQPSYHNHLGHALRSMGKFDEAIEAYRVAVAVKPDFSSAYNNLGNALEERGDTRGAAEAYDRALRAVPDATATWYNYGNLMKKLGHLVEAAECYERALNGKSESTDFDIDPDSDELALALDALVNTKRELCAWNDLDTLETKLAAAVRDGKPGVSRFGLLAVAPTPALQLAITRSCAQSDLLRLSDEGRARRFQRSDREKLRIGYVSADYYSHATAYLTAEMFELHDRGQFEVYGYSYGPDDDSPVRRRIVQAFDRFSDCRELSWAGAAEQILRDQVDILVDLKGYTKDSRPEVFARRSAPIQVNYLGYPGTMGADFMDYILVDDFIVPPEQQPYYTEKLVYLPGCYQINDRKRTVDETPSRHNCGLPGDAFVFCCFNHVYKITPEVFDSWMRLLRAVPGSVLWLLESNIHAAANLKRAASNRGVDPQRLIFAPKVSQSAHVARLGVADLFLDTFPITAHTSASDALWAGCPVLTRVGETFVSRVAGSVLRAAGIPELITTSPAEYEATAICLANDPAAMARLKARLAENRLTCRLFDSRTTTRAIEAAFKKMWTIHTSGEPPQSFTVPPAGPATEDGRN